MVGVIILDPLTNSFAPFLLCYHFQSDLCQGFSWFVQNCTLFDPLPPGFWIHPKHMMSCSFWVSPSKLTSSSTWYFQWLNWAGIWNLFNRIYQVRFVSKKHSDVFWQTSVCFRALWLKNWFTVPDLSRNVHLYSFASLVWYNSFGLPSCLNSAFNFFICESNLAWKLLESSRW